MPSINFCVDYELQNANPAQNKLLGEAPEDQGYNCVTWTGPMLMDWIQQNLGFVCKKAQIYNILKSIGFTYQKGRDIFPETDFLAKEAFKESLKKFTGRST